MDREKLNKKIKETYYQDFVINEDLSLTPNNLALHKLKFMEDTFMKDLDGKRVLDVGCSFGYFCIEAKRRGAKYVLGIDQSSEYICLAKKIAKFVDEEIDYEPRKFSSWLGLHKPFDVIILCSVYHYMFGTYGDHDFIFKTLAEIGKSIFWENPHDMQDESCKEYFDNHLPAFEKLEYTPKKILEAAGKYFKLRRLGVHLHKHRHIYWMEKK